MLFVGDIALPPCTDSMDAGLPVLGSKCVVANLEGALIADAVGLLNRKVVFNDAGVVQYLVRCGVRAVSLANNHVMDCADSLGDTIRVLAGHGIACCGAGPDARTAAEPVVLTDGQTPVVLLAFGWEPIGYRAAGPGRSGVNPMRTRHVLQSVAHLRALYSEARIALLMHWNFELEAYPQPAHRRLARAAIDAGASAVIGCHPHCVQGIEQYKDAPIVYSLGNWLFPHGRYWGEPCGSRRTPLVSWLSSGTQERDGPRVTGVPSMRARAPCSWRSASRWTRLPGSRS